jgi:hypothetical protein
MSHTFLVHVFLLKNVTQMLRELFGEVSRKDPFQGWWGGSSDKHLPSKREALSSNFLSC